ncbi:hypothetical protein ACKGJY_14470 [Hyunsoonleella sp. 2307UL5-6]|uniref:hypothetical protein n=1 Tax=Hyunsoonleella sp. 2307UL5-6 TaxID=3384768 RepID=UPI0039BCE621
MNFEFKFKGVLKGTSFDMIDSKAIKMLVDTGVYYECSDFNKCFYTNENDFKIGKDFAYDGKNYSISDDVLYEIYKLMEFECEFICDFYEEKKIIDVRLVQFFRDKQKIEFLEDLYEQTLAIIETDFSYLSYIGEDSKYTWQEYVFEYIRLEHALIEKHLNNEFYEFYDDNKLFSIKSKSLFYKIMPNLYELIQLQNHTPIIRNNDSRKFEIVLKWHKFKEVKEISSYCLNRIEALGKETTCSKTNQNTLSNRNKKKLRFTTIKQVALFEDLMKIESGKWDNLSATKKGEVLEPLFDKNADNIKTHYLSFEKTPSEHIKLSQKSVRDFLNSKFNVAG